MPTELATSPLAGLHVDPLLKTFVETELLPDLGLDAGKFWMDLEALFDELTPENRALLAERDLLQSQIDAYHRERRATPFDLTDYKSFLRKIGYLEPPSERFSVETENVDAEIARIPGPQLVVPVSNARFALNAANARWGSLYDALYGSDVIPETEGHEAGATYNPVRGAAVIAFAAEFLGDALPLARGHHANVVSYELTDDCNHKALRASLNDGTSTALRDTNQFVGFRSDKNRSGLLFRHHGLHIELVIDPSHPVGSTSPSGLSDVILEAAITTIQDCEDSVAAVDAADKVGVYRNWLGLMRGTLVTEFEKQGKTVVRRLNDDRHYQDVNGNEMRLSGRSLMLVRNVGHLMTTPAIYDANGDEVFEGLLDAVMTTACALHDLKAEGTHKNSRTGSVYIVKPKMHGSKEVAFADKLFARVEDMFGLDRNTLKIGIMDEERRTSVNLENCLHAARHRVVFINTGFLDRTGDEIHTSMEAGPMLPKDGIKQQGWIAAYEDRNVDVGIRCGLPGKGQIGKGMWPKPDEMRQMLDTKQEHPEAGANCAWVPSPTAATLHAMHYHRVDVHKIQAQLQSREAASVDLLLTPPLAEPEALAPEIVEKELNACAQSILGYVVRWIDQGIGCSKVPDVDDVGLMEDRATLRISSQLIANWLHHGICDAEAVRQAFQRMAKVVDEQNAGDRLYAPMAPDYDGVAFMTALELALLGAEQSNGYTEPLLHRHRRRQKALAL